MYGTYLLYITFEHIITYTTYVIYHPRIVFLLIYTTYATYLHHLIGHLRRADGAYPPYVSGATVFDFFTAAGKHN